MEVSQAMHQTRSSRAPMTDPTPSFPSSSYAERERERSRLYTASQADLLAELDTSREGLSADEAEKRLTKYGPNEATTAPHLSNLKQFLLFLANPLVIILFVASLVSAILGQQLNSAIIIVIVLLSVILNFIQTS